ncbi:MAG: DMT family transporter [Eubacteriales bacterium]|nr:DMT family transporter [Eubacteriales bacterium]
MFRDSKGASWKAILASVIFTIILALIATFQKWTALQFNNSTLVTILFIITLVLYGLFSLVWQELNHYISLRLGRLIRATSLFWIIVAAIVFYGERLSSHVWIAAVFIFAGILFAQAGSVENEDEGRAKYRHFMGDVFSAPAYLDFGARGEDSKLLNSAASFYHKRKTELAERRIRREAERQARAEMEAANAKRLAEAESKQTPMAAAAPGAAVRNAPETSSSEKSALDPVDLEAAKAAADAVREAHAAEAEIQAANPATGTAGSTSEGDHRVVDHPQDIQKEEK